MHKKIKRVYVDSSVVGGKFNTRLAEQTKPFWDAVARGEITIIISDVLDLFPNLKIEKIAKIGKLAVLEISRRKMRLSRSR